MKNKQLYFLCTGNSCRSQMAEGFAKQYLRNWTIKSAGIEAHGVNSVAVQVMAEKNIDLTTHTSDIIDTDTLHQSTLIVTLCQHAADQCPIIPVNIKHEHWGFNDPAKFEGNEAEILGEFRSVRDAIESKIKCFASEQILENS